MSQKTKHKTNVIALENIESWTGRLQTSSAEFDGDGDGVEFQKGDILFGKLRPYLAKVHCTQKDGEAIGDLWALRSADDCDPAYLTYFLLNREFIETVNASTNGAKMPRADWDFVGSIPTLTPPPDEQAAIANYLDRETARIDGLIEKKGRFISLLKEKRAAAVTHAVTRGLNKNAAMTEVAKTWFGSRVPAHWSVHRIATLFKEAFRDGDPSDPVLSVSIHNGVTDGELADEDRLRKVALSEDRTKYQGVAPGDLVYNMMRAWQGAFGAVTVDGLVSPAYVVAQPIAEFRTKFIEHLLHTKTASEEIRRFSRGIADFRMRLYWDQFRNLRVCLPPLAEQDEILAHIEVETTRIESLISKTERSIALLREKRAALITAAVTGKIDVRNAA